MKNDIIKESFSPWNTSVHLVLQKTDASGEKKYRLAGDFRKQNEITTYDRYPLSNITDIFDKLGKSCYFTFVLASGYHQIEVEHKDLQKAAFSAQAGHFEFARMPFGLKRTSDFSESYRQCSTSIAWNPLFSLI